MHYCVIWIDFFQRGGVLGIRDLFCLLEEFLDGYDHGAGKSILVEDLEEMKPGSKQFEMMVDQALGMVFEEKVEGDGCL